MARLKEQYKAEVAPALYKKFGYKSTMQIPKIDKVVVNVGCGEAKENAKVLEAVVRDLTTITGQKAVVTKAKKSIANFKLREDMPIGAKVTLRGDKMWEFLDRLFNVALPRVRDFRGISANAFDGRGNYALGIKEQLIFPEIEYDKIDKIRGMDIVICTTAQTDEEARELLTLVGALAEKARLPVLPEVGIYPAEEMNAFATGSSKSDAMIAFSQGLLDHMDEESIAGVAAHETAHIANGDMLTMTLLTGLVNIGVMIIDFAMRQMDWYDELRDKSKTLAFIVHVVLVNLLFFVGNLLLLWFSRHREFEADETAASLVGNASMSGALKRLMEDDNIGTLTEAGEPIAAMMISAPSAWCDFFSTHPSLERRIQHLLKIS